MNCVKIGSGARFRAGRRLAARIDAGCECDWLHGLMDRFRACGVCGNGRRRQVPFPSSTTPPSVFGRTKGPAMGKTAISEARRMTPVERETMLTKRHAERPVPPQFWKAKPANTPLIRRPGGCLDQLYADGVLRPSHVAAAQAFDRLRGGGRTKVEKALTARVGATGAALIAAVCEGVTPAQIALSAGFVRPERPDLGDARKSHVAIRLAFDALAEVMAPDLTDAPGAALVGA